MLAWIHPMLSLLTRMMLMRHFVDSTMKQSPLWVMPLEPQQLSSVTPPFSAPLLPAFQPVKKPARSLMPQCAWRSIHTSSRLSAPALKTHRSAIGRKSELFLPIGERSAEGEGLVQLSLFALRINAHANHWYPWWHARLLRSRPRRVRDQKSH